MLVQNLVEIDYTQASVVGEGWETYGVGWQSLQQLLSPDMPGPLIHIQPSDHRLVSDQTQARDLPSRLGRDCRGQGTPPVTHSRHLPCN